MSGKVRAVRGHLFVVQGNLTLLDSDAVVLPCDEGGNIGSQWAPFLPPAAVEPGPWGLRLVDAELEAGVHGSLGIVGERHVQLVATAGSRSPLAVDDVVDRVIGSVSRAIQSLEPRRNRRLPLVTLPLAGTGAGGLAHERGSVVRSLVPALVELTRTIGVDVALVLHDRRDYAAVQAARADLEGQVPGGWEILTQEQLDSADELGGRAARGELSLFVGSGVSVPLGLPNWHQLLELMAKKVRPKYVVPDAVDLLDEAAGFVWLLGDDYEPFMRELFDPGRHALGHSLLAGLNVRRMVTTNYDPCLELALGGIHGREYEVLTRSLASGGRPWLLKLHGDIRAPGSLVLTRAEYERLADEGRALHGVVESLMLTSHVLFVGYSLVDHDFGQVAEGVRRVRDRAADAASRPCAGTALALHPASVDAEQWQGEVDVLAMGSKADIPAAARTLEVFLDRVAWASLQGSDLASEYLLDPRYEKGATAAERVLVDTLRSVIDARHTEASQAAGWPKVAQLLRSLGWDEDT